MSETITYKEFKNINIHKDSKEMIYIACTNFMDELEDELKFQEALVAARDDYIQTLENKLLEVSTDLSGFLLAENIKGPRVKAREKANENRG